jgi:chromate transporter
MEMIALIKLSFYLGLAAFGGPAAHIAMMYKECVEKRKWVSEEDFLSYLSLSQLIPGPNSTEMLMHIGAHKKSWRGLVVAGVAFITPAAALTIGLTAIYKTYGHIPEWAGFKLGIEIGVVGLITLAIHKLGRKAVLNVGHFVVTMIAGLLTILKVPAPIVIINMGVLYLIFDGLRGRKINADPLWILCGSLLKIGSILVGSGYVLISYLDHELVTNLKLLTHPELLDLVAIGQLTPGPILTTATAIGYYLHGLQGGILATIAIFLPSFFFVLSSFKVRHKLLAHSKIQAFMSGAGAASVGLMIATVFNIAQSTLGTPIQMVGLVLSICAFNYTKIPTLLVLLGFGFLGLLL